MDSPWNFADPPETEVITLDRILRGQSSILLVTHDAEDGTWQFLDGEHVFEEDGAVVSLGEIVDFDPSLAVLADLPEGWFAWRPDRVRPWTRAQGEEPLGAGRRRRFTDSETEEATNIEIKARIADFDRFRETAESMSDAEVQVLNQEDFFFSSPHGRLKLRIFNERCGELIHYHRADAADPKASHYRIAPTSDPCAMKSILSQILPVAGIVKKQRWLYHVGQTRIHLDRVDGLGDFVELEVVLRPGQEQGEGVAIAQELMRRLGIVEDQLVKVAYVDLLSTAKQTVYDVERGMIQQES
jgi:predicted adenylyl cyclase CyaB